MNSLLINADDFGLTDGICRSIAELFNRGAISNTTVMICVDGAHKRCREYLDPTFRHYAGVHLQLTPEEHHRRPLSSRHEIPTLVDSNGNFKPKGHTDWVNPDEVRLEWERQILGVADALGHSPSHLDSHHGVHRIPDLTPICFELAKKYRLSVRGGTGVDGSKVGVHTSAVCSSDWTGQNQGLEELKGSILKHLSLARGGTVEIVAHPGYCDEDLIRSSTWNRVRENDHAVLLALSEERWLDSQMITLERYRAFT